MPFTKLLTTIFTLTLTSLAFAQIPLGTGDFKQLECDLPGSIKPLQISFSRFSGPEASSTAGSLSLEPDLSLHKGSRWETSLIQDGSRNHGKTYLEASYFSSFITRAHEVHVVQSMRLTGIFHGINRFEGTIKLKDFPTSAVSCKFMAAATGQLL